MTRYAAAVRTSGKAWRVIAACALGACGGGGGDAPVDGAAVGGDGPAAGDAAPAFDPLDGAGEVELVSDGFMFTEGPVWRADDGVLLFSDIDGNCIHRLSPPDAIDVFRADSGRSNGLASDADGLLLAAEHGGRRLSRTLANGTVETVVDHFEEILLNSPNDIAVRADGTIYFTDPPYGIDPEEQDLDFNGLFRVDPDGDLTAEWRGGLDSRPNGVALSPDQRTLYLADTTAGLTAFTVESDGSLSDERPFVPSVPNADGLAVDTGGNVYVAAADGVRVYAPDGSLWGTIAVARQPANAAFGDEDARTLYITARQGLYRVRLANPGIW